MMILINHLSRHGYATLLLRRVYDFRNVVLELSSPYSSGAGPGIFFRTTDLTEMNMAIS